jgi:hypothetical protein
MERVFSRTVIACVLAGTVAGCRGTGGGREAAGAAPDGGCRTQGEDDPVRARRVRDLLATTETGRRLLAGPPGRLPIRFRHAPEPVITTDGTILLDPCMEDAASAARLGHLLQHAADGAVLPPGPRRSLDGGSWTDDPAGAEARAIAVEIEVRRTLGIKGPAAAALPVPASP